MNRVLFITRDVPSEIAHGASFRNWQNISILSRSAKIAVFSLAKWTPAFKALPRIDQWVHCNPAEQKRAQSLDKKL